MWRGRLRELLSDGELGEQQFATMLPDLDDCVEQCPLTTEDSAHLLTAYGERDTSVLIPGTVELCRQLGIKHPKISDSSETTLWRATTDLVLVFKREQSPRTLLALAFKPSGWDKGRRTKELLKLEREYWIRRGVPWLLITPELYDFRVVLTLRRIACWALAEDVPIEARRLAARVARERAGFSVTRVLEVIASMVGSMELSQRALWQAVWNGDLPIDLRRGWRPHVPLQLIPADEFTNLNPIASRRSAWI